MKPDKSDKRIFFLSDVHLGFVEDEVEQDKREKLYAFFDHVKAEGDVLVIAGDLFDFLQIDGQLAQELSKKETPFEITKRERKFGLGTEEDKTVWKLGVIAKGHNVFFQALGNFLSMGNRLSIITGNHDIELYWKKVQNIYGKTIKQILIKKI